MELRGRQADVKVGAQRTRNLRRQELAQALAGDAPDHFADQVLGAPVRFGTGFALGHPAFAGHSGRVCWWAGFGGALVVNDLDRRLTIAYVMNKMAPGLINLERGGAYVRTIYAALDGAS
jgi:CubicO group peptidase (beta-lactamase class C family)